MEGLVVVRLGHRYIVLEAAFDRNPCGVDYSEDRIAFNGRLAYYPDTEDIVDLIDLLLPLLDLLVYRVGVLDPSCDLYIGDSCLPAGFSYRP